ncbi:hypothetical protein V1505DRAFT_153971, partial [Lipomyces doorenjongii]
MKPIRHEYLTITTIDQRKVDLGTEALPIYHIRGRIPTLGKFHADTIEMPLGPDTDLVLGAEWLRECGLLQKMERELGIAQSPTEEGDHTDTNEAGRGNRARDPVNTIDTRLDEVQQEITDSLSRSAGVRVDRSWIPFHS